MANSFIHYIKREIVLNTPDDPNASFYAELQDYNAGFDAPKFHVTRAKSWPVKDIKEDDVIWLIGQLSSPWGKLLPAIDGKIVVGNIEEIKYEDGKTKMKFSAKDGSVWFPLVDVTPILSNLEIVLKSGDVRKAYSQHTNIVGQIFQTMKKIHNPELLENWASEVLNKEIEFVSYRIADGTKGAFLKTKEEMKKGNAIFWDRWSLPRRLAERRELVSDEALDKLLVKKIRESAKVWGIESSKYDEAGSYSQKEKKLAKELNKYNSFAI